MSPSRLRAALTALAVSVTSVSLAAFGTGTSVAASAPDPGLATAVGKVMKDSRVTSGTTGVAVLNGNDGRLLYQRNGSAALTPASNTKLLTAMAALDYLGSAYTFRTEALTGSRVVGGTLRGNLYLKGYGDPTLRESDLRTLARSVRAKGITTISGNLAIDASFFDAQRYNPTWSKAYADDYYAAEITPLTLAPNADYDAGTVLVNVRPGAKGKRAKISFTPSSAKSYLKVSNKITTKSRGSSTSFSVTRAYNASTIKLRGRIAQGRGTSSRLITVHRPDRYATAVFRAQLAKAGVRVLKPTTIMTAPASARTVLARDYSMPLSSLLVPFLKLSNNMHAEALTKAMAAKRTGRAGTWADGLAVTRAFLSRVGTPMADLRLTDGSGLTRSNKISARAMTTALYAAQRQPWFGTFRYALPEAGNTKRMVGGTLRYRMNGTRAAGNARAKTGTLTGVTALSGYVTGRDGTPYVFSMISNYRGRTPRPVENTFVVTLANWRR